MVVKTLEIETEKERRAKKNSKARLLRAETWMEGAKQVDENIKLQGKNKKIANSAISFVLWWIALEATYKKRQKNRKTNELHAFISDIGRNQKQKEELKKILGECQKEACNLVSLPYIHKGFWENRKTKKGRQYKDAKEWRKKFKEIETTYNDDNTDILEKIKILFSRLQVARNQIFHGANSRGDSWGLTQTQEGVKILRIFVPYFIKQIRKNSNHDWGEVLFPHVGNKRDDNNVDPPWSKS